MAHDFLKGLGVALVTPFRQDKSIDYEALERIVERTINGGCDYLVALGTTAETPTLSLEEKEKITRFIVEKAQGRIPLIVGIGGNNTKAVADDIRNRDLSGYSAILSVTPYYNKPTQEGLYRHFMYIAETSPLPIILYNVPGRTGVNMTANTTLRLSAACSNIIGIKEASGNHIQCEEIMKGCRDDFHLISGNDPDTVSLMKKGASGVISVLANVLPDKMKIIVDNCLKSNYSEAERMNYFLNPLMGQLFEEGNPAGIKAMLSAWGLIENILRLPLVAVNPHLENKIKSTLATIKII
ncbi:MAG: 4-hydroxy-tetrahydrodipicolinate synthase [Muribaculaceae bacterium]|nr:4-hydroxy-tetrahydrodipicolinate synthase [Muribaculaceae bacterium]